MSLCQELNAICIPKEFRRKQFIMFRLAYRNNANEVLFCELLSIDKRVEHNKCTDSILLSVVQSFCSDWHIGMYGYGIKKERDDNEPSDSDQGNPLKSYVKSRTR